MDRHIDISMLNITKVHNTFNDHKSGCSGCNKTTTTDISTKNVIVQIKYVVSFFNILPFTPVLTVLYKMNS